MLLIEILKPETTIVQNKEKRTTELSLYSYVSYFHCLRTFFEDTIRHTFFPATIEYFNIQVYPIIDKAVEKTNKKYLIFIIYQCKIKVVSENNFSANSIFFLSCVYF